jgi:hypothetical protein
MKKLLLLFVFAAFSSAIYAQLGTAYVTTPNTFVSVSTDYNITNTTAGEYIFKGAQHTPSTQDFLVELDSVSGNHTNVEVALYGRKFDSAAWASIGSAVDWAGTTADTTIIISNTTANRYRDYKVVYTGTGTGVTKVDLQEFKLYQE